MSDLGDELLKKKIINFSDEELVQAGFMGDGAPESVRSTVLEIKENPDHLGFITGFMLDCQRQMAPNDISAAPLSLTLSDTSTLFSTVSVTSDSALTAVNPNLVSEFEKYNYYVGLCASNDNVPLLYYRTSLKNVPFPTPTPGTKWFKVPHKTANGPFDKVLTRQLWGTIIGPKIISKVLNARGIRYQSLEATRFSTHDEAGNKTLGPIVIWIGTHHGTTSPGQARNASPDILGILEEHGVSDAEVEWFESRV